MNTSRTLAAAILFAAGTVSFAAQAADFTIPDAPATNVQLTRAQVKQETMRAAAQGTLAPSEVSAPKTAFASTLNRADVKAEAVANARLPQPTYYMN